MMKKENTNVATFQGFEKFSTIEQEVLKNIIGGGDNRRIGDGTLFWRK